MPADPRRWTSCAARRFCSSSLFSRRSSLLLAGFWFLLVLAPFASDYQSSFCSFVVVVLLIPLLIDFSEF
ncbi:uncharacterized protein DS421_14g449440 [Arachis hypogaea]|nr:uncharacterized protein DS421_14g449440 [Arachis hypogaea]